MRQRVAVRIKPSVVYCVAESGLGYVKRGRLGSIARLALFRSLEGLYLLSRFCGTQAHNTDDMTPMPF